MIRCEVSHRTEGSSVRVKSSKSNLGAKRSDQVPTYWKTIFVPNTADARLYVEDTRALEEKVSGTSSWTTDAMVTPVSEPVLQAKSSLCFIIRGIPIKNNSTGWCMTASATVHVHDHHRVRHKLQSELQASSTYARASCFRGPSRVRGAERRPKSFPSPHCGPRVLSLSKTPNRSYMSHRRENLGYRHMRLELVFSISWSIVYRDPMSSLKKKARCSLSVRGTPPT